MGMLQVEPEKSKQVTWDRRNVLHVARKRLPLSYFDDEETQDYFKLLNESVIMPRRNAMSKILFDEFSKMRENLKSILAKNDSKFSFNVDGWSAPNLTSFYGISVHFIDKIWKMPSITLELIPSKGLHSGKDIAKTFYGCLEYFDLKEKINGITLDNVASNTTFILELKVLFDKDGIEFDVENQHFKCFLHIFNLGVQDILHLVNKNSRFLDQDENCESDDEESDDENDNLFYVMIVKVRSIFKKLRGIETLRNTLKSFCDATNIKFIKPVLDVRTRWNSTFEMLNVFFKLLPALRLLWDNCPVVNSYKLHNDQLSTLKTVFELLRYFQYLTKILSSDKDVSLPTAVVGLNTLLDKLEETMSQLNNKPDVTPEDDIIISSLVKGRDKLIKHYKKCNWVYCVALLLDPRFKLEGFDSTEWGRDLKNMAEKKFKDIFRYEYYNKHIIESVEDTLQNSIEEDFVEFKNVYAPKSNVSWESELKKYFASPRASFESNILEWWSNHEKDYPIISKMARDILGITASTIYIERFFSAGPLIMTNRRNKLKNETLNALMCIYSWQKSVLETEICYK